MIDENLSCKEIRIFAMSKQIASKLKRIEKIWRIKLYFRKKEMVNFIS